MKAVKWLWGIAVALHFAGLPAWADASMTFTADTSGQGRWRADAMHGGVTDVYASGDITDGTADRLMDFLKSNMIAKAKIHFDSDGGSLFEGMKLGRTIRSLGLMTAVGAYRDRISPSAAASSICASACAYAFAGGAYRFFDGTTGRLGVHQFYARDDERVSTETVQQVSGLVVAYLEEMDIDAVAFSVSTAAARNDMIWLTPDMALSLRFANNGAKSPEAEIRMNGMTPYLRIQQEHHDVTTRVLFLCENNAVNIMFGIVTNSDTTAMNLLLPKRSYLELDRRESLVRVDRNGLSGMDSTLWIERALTVSDVMAIAKSTVVEGWVDGSGAVRFGASL